MNRIVQILVRFFLRWVPDAFAVAIVLSLLTFALAVSVAGYSPRATLESWGDSFWNLLTFTNQITLTLLLGFAFANTPPIRRALLAVAGVARTPVAAYALGCGITGLCSLFNWGLGLIACGIMSRAIGESCRTKGVPIHYPLLVASSFSGFVIWHQGVSASIALTIATPGHFLESSIGLVDLSATLFNGWNALVVVAVLSTLPFVMAALRPRGREPVEPIPDHLIDRTAGPAAAPAASVAPATPAQRVESSRLLNLTIVACGLFYLWVHFFARGLGLNLNILNFSFLVAGIVLAGSPMRYISICLEGGRVAVPFLLQYPFYAGIAGVMADSGLALQVVELFTRTSTAQTLPFFGFLSGGLLNLFIPSGGGQWAVQGPIMMEAAQRIGADVPRVAMGVAFGDQWTNLIQPLTIVPVLTIAGLHLREIMGYTFFALFWSGLLFSVALLAF